MRAEIDAAAFGERRKVANGRQLAPRAVAHRRPLVRLTHFSPSGHSSLETRMAAAAPWGGLWRFTSAGDYRRLIAGPKPRIPLQIATTDSTSPPGSKW